MSLLRSSVLLVLILVSVSAMADAPTTPAAAPPAGVLPTAADGRPLNLDLERGTLDDWIAVGEAFNEQPVKGELARDNKRAVPRETIGLARTSGSKTVRVAS